MSYSVSRADLTKDRESLLKFWQEQSGRSLDNKFNWAYTGNPDGKAHVWFLKIDDTNEVVGVAALFPRKIKINGQTYMAGVAGDLLVHEKHRTIGPAIQLLRTVISSGEDCIFDVIYTFPNIKANLVAKRAGLNAIGPTQRYVIIFRVKRQLIKRGIPNILASIIAPLIDIGLKLRANNTYSKLSNSVQIHKIDNFDDVFEDLWNERQSGYFVVPDRSSEYMNWKFFEDPDDENYAYGAYTQDGATMLGCIIYRRDEESLEIRELILRNDPLVRKMVIGRFLRLMRSQLIESIFISLLENEKIANELNGYGFIKRDKERNVYFAASENLKSETNLLKNPDNWLLMTTDEDT